MTGSIKLLNRDGAGLNPLSVPPGTDEDVAKLVGIVPWVARLGEAGFLGEEVDASVKLEVF